MPQLAYNLSPNIQRCLGEIDTLRKSIVLTPINPKISLRLRWNSEIERVYWAFSLTDYQYTKQEVADILIKRSEGNKKLPREKRLILDYKKALDYIRSEWLAANKEINAGVVRNLFDIAIRKTAQNPSITRFNSREKLIDHLMDYLRTGREHPVIQAGIAHIQILGLSPFNEGNGRISKLLTYLILYKEGYDLNDLFYLEEYFRKDLVSLKEAVKSVDSTQNMTLWLEYFTKGVVIQLEKTYENIKTERFGVSTPYTFWKLNERQQEILRILQNPNEKVNNTRVQRLFNTSQITASRDLAKLTNLGLLFPHAKGRSTYYTRV